MNLRTSFMQAKISHMFVIDMDEFLLYDNVCAYIEGQI